MINDLTVIELENLIRKVVSEELAKRYVYIPTQTYYEPYCPYKTTRITCTDHTEMRKE